MDDEKELASEDLMAYSFSSIQEILNRYSNCVICGAHLHFTHVTDFSRNLTQEIAKCPECGIRARNLIHRLQ